MGEIILHHFDSSLHEPASSCVPAMHSNAVNGSKT